MKPILEIKGISKKFRIRHELLPYDSLRDRIMDVFKGKKFHSQEEFWALKNVSFEVNEGESIGIVGKNGAGKSTLLKILSKITPPTSGKIICRGRIASLLEVGTGFHAELTGRENIFLNGSILGMRRNEIYKKFDEIVDFSGVEKFLDTPLKHYSSGMQLRLAFAVAAFLEPEVLVIDEVLAVGDAEFQKKCMGKMTEVTQSGRTILFVSHNMAAIRQLCSKAILLESGKLVMNNGSEEVIDHYLRQQSQMGNSYMYADADAPQNKNVALRAIRIHAKDKTPEEVIFMNEEVEIEIIFENRMEQFLDITIDLFDDQTNHLFHVGTVCSGTEKLTPGTYVTKGIIPANLLNCRTYTLNLIFGENQRHVLLKIDYIAAFTVEQLVEKENFNAAKLPGIIHPLLKWNTQKYPI